jgi:hypothetical protein
MLATVPNFVPHLGRKPSQTIGESAGHESPLVAQRFKTIANHRTSSKNEPLQLLTEMLQVRVLPGEPSFALLPQNVIGNSIKARSLAPIGAISLNPISGEVLRGKFSDRFYS